MLAKVVALDPEWLPAVVNKQDKKSLVMLVYHPNCHKFHSQLYCGSHLVIQNYCDIGTHIEIYKSLNFYFGLAEKIISVVWNFLNECSLIDVEVASGRTHTIKHSMRRGNNILYCDRCCIMLYCVGIK